MQHNKWTETHSKTEDASDKLLNMYFTTGDIESIRAVASGLIAQLTEEQAQEHLEAFQEQYEAYADA